MMNRNTAATITIRQLYPHLSDNELAQSEENLDRYLVLMLRIFERLEFEAKTEVDTLTPQTGTL